LHFGVNGSTHTLRLSVKARNFVGPFWAHFLEHYCPKIKYFGSSQ